MGEPIPIKLPPGMFRNGTEYESAGRWYDGNLVRWHNSSLKPIGGWQAVAQPALTGVARGGITYTSDIGFPFTIIGTNSNLYIGEGGRYTNVTPTLVPALQGGNVDTILGAGYGAGLYGVPPGYGLRRATASIELDAATWQFDIFGNTAVMVLSSDRILRVFDPSTGVVAKAPNSPTCVGVFTTNEDFVVALGAGGNSRNAAWGDVGSYSIWTPTDLNSAGDINLNTQGVAVAGARVGLQNLVWSTIDVHLFNYVGQPAIYAPIRIGTACGLIGPHAFAVAATGAGAGEAAYWMSNGGFFQYTGAVTPLPCEVQDYIFDNINFDQAKKIYASTNSLFREVIWFFPSKDSQEVDSYVIYNYKDNIWYFGLHSSLARTTYLDQGCIPLPLGVDAGGLTYEHETGYLANHATRVGQVFAVSGPAEIGNGDRVIYSDMMIVDGDGLLNPDAAAVLTMTPKARMTPQGPIIAANPIPFIPNPEGYTPVRFCGRQIALRFDIAQDYPWRLGKLRLYVVGGSKR